MAHPEIPEGHGEIDYDSTQQRKTPPKSDIDKDHGATQDKEAIIR